MVTEEKSLAKAGERLGLTQPAVSQHIKALEEQYGLPLFDHTGRKLVLNEAGRLVRNVTGQALSSAVTLEKRLRNLIDGRNHFTIGATLTIGEFILPAYLGEYRRLFPNRELTIDIGNTVTILDKLRRGFLDLAVVEGPFDAKLVRSRLFKEDEMIFIGSREFIRDSWKHIGKQELEQSRLILREEGSGTRFYWEEYRKKHHLQLGSDSVIMEVGSLSAIKSLVEAGCGCSIISKTAVEKELLLGTLLTLPFSYGPLLRNLYFISMPESPESFINEFMDFCANFPIVDA